MKVIGIGDNVCDKYYPAMMMYPGGQAMNFAVYAKMLGADASYMGVFGNDAVADHVICTLDELQVEHARCRQYEGENGYAKVRLVDGDRQFIMSNRGGVVNEHPLELDEEDMEYIKGFRLVHTSNNGHFNHCLAKVKEAGVLLSYDFSGRWNEESYYDEVVPYVDYAFLSCGDTPEEHVKEVCKRMASLSCKIVVATRGGLGSMIFDGHEFYMQAPHKVEAVDTLGAGDSFATAFLMAILSGKSVSEAGEAGAEFASKTCMVNGAFGHGIPFEE